jgi:hypothetical protein
MSRVAVALATQPQLNWLAAKIRGLAVSSRATAWRAENAPHLYTSDWNLTGPIISEFKIDLKWSPGGGECFANIHRKQEFPCGLRSIWAHSSDPMDAAIRAFVVANLGRVVDVPDGL